MTRRKAITAATLLSASLATGFHFLRRHPMQPADSQNRLEHLITSGGRTLATLTAAEAIRFMLAFYRDVRADNCPLDEEGDMLLFQFGAYNWGEGETYNYDITRQFIVSGSEGDDGMSQLCLTVHFTVTDTLRAIKGNRWCSSPAQADEFEQFIRSNPATQAVAILRPLKVTLDWSPI
jgi:hypothetical protein